MKKYMVKEIFGPTFQGEGSLCGQPTLFLRMAGCNQWDGRPETKEASACPFCDTDFRGGSKMTVEEIGQALMELAPPLDTIVTISGGEPLLQVDALLLETIWHIGYRIAVETNGTRAMPMTPDGIPVHVTLSPKVPRAQIALEECDDLKVLYPHPDPEITPESFRNYPAKTKFIQPVNGEDEINQENLCAAIKKATELTTTLGPWGVSIQTHKIMGVP